MTLCIFEDILYIVDYQQKHDEIFYQPKFIVILEFTYLE